MSDDVAYLTATELVALYRRKELSPVETARVALDRIGRLDKEINAFCHLDPEATLAAARESEARWAKGEPMGLVDGVPTTVKDLVVTRGWPTLRGSLLTQRNQAWDEDAPSVARLREHGAVLLGKTTTPEFGWKALGDSPLTGITRNPWNLERTPGGSSAGAAAALAAGIGALAIGTDGGGSIRIPCGFTGTVGIKATYGRVPAHPASAMGILANIGPMTRSVADCALMLRVIAGTDARDPYRLPPTDEDYGAGIDQGVRGLRIAYSADLGYADVDPDVRAAVDEAVGELAEMGARVEAVDPGFANPRDAFMTLWTAGAARMLSGLSPAEREKLDPGLAASVEHGAALSAVDYLKADAERTELGRRMGEFFLRYDLLATPTVAIPAPPAGQDYARPGDRYWVDWTPFSYPFNMTRQPAATVPCGISRDGLPIGLQLVGPLYAEATVLRAARAYESRHPFRRPPPLG